jgi:hypothetical protein
MERIRRNGELPCYQPRITREAVHKLWEMKQETGQFMTVILNAIIVEAHQTLMEQVRVSREIVREEALVESGYAPTVFVRPPGEEWRGL